MPILASPTLDPLPPTHGPRVAAWMEAELVHGEGDHEGEPYRLTGHGLRWLYRWFEYDPAARSYLHHKGLIGVPKGNTKTEWEAALALEHLEGPSWVAGTPVVTLAAVDGDQAAEIARIAGMLVHEQPLEDRLEVTAGRILQRRGHGRVNASSASLGKNEGKRTSLLLCDELHEWDGLGQPVEAAHRRHSILERNTNKRGGGRHLDVSTAGWSLETLLGAAYTYGTKVAAGELVDPGFLFEWWEASEGYDLDEPEQLLAAIYEANPAADVCWPATNLVRSYHDHKLRGEANDWIRYHLNRWVGVLEDAWMDLEAWAERARPGPPPPDGTEVVLGFDGSVRGDSTAIVGATVDDKPHVFEVHTWERDERDRDWKVPVTEVEDALVVACTRRWRVKEVAADVSYWRGSLERLAERGLPILDFQQTPASMAPACERFYEAVTRDQMSHDGSPGLNRHIANCRRHETEFGTRIVKEHSHSARRIDRAVAAVMAFSRAQFWALQDDEAPELISF